MAIEHFNYSLWLLIIMVIWRTSVIHLRSLKCRRQKTFTEITKKTKVMYKWRNKNKMKCFHKAIISYKFMLVLLLSSCCPMNINLGLLTPSLHYTWSRLPTCMLKLYQFQLVLQTYICPYVVYFLPSQY